MAADPSVIAAIAAAVQAQPGNAALRIHLAGLLLGAGEHARALEEAAAALAVSPADVTALALARDAAKLTGDAARADGYSRLLAALRGGHDPRGGDDPDTRAAGLDARSADDFDPRAGDHDPRAGDRDPRGGDEPPRPRSADEPPRLRAGDEPELQDEDEDSDDEPEDDGRSLLASLAFGPEPLTLADVGGMEEVKQRLDAAFLAPLRNPELGAMYGTSLRGGLLLYGPPGCGKTFLARAVAGELDASFLTIGISDVLDMYLGESERRLHELFVAARENAPCVIFLDELDALGRKRSQMRNSAGRTLVNQLLQDLDGAVSANDGVFVLAATNHPWDIDTALRRPGRLDRTVLVLPPDAPARAAILERALGARRHDARDLGPLVKQTDGYSGADLVQLVEVAAQEALQDALRTGEAKPIRLGTLLAAAKEVKPSTGGWFNVAYNHAIYANDTGEYDDLLAHIRRKKLR